ESTLKFVSWNTNGLKSNNKFSTLLKILSDIQADVAFIQETHVGPDCYKKILKNHEGWNVFFTVHSSKTKGVAILIKKTVKKFKYICHDEDCNGSYIVLFCHLFGELHTLVNVYNHKADKFFLAKLKDYLVETAEGVLVVGGDFNTVLHPSFDRKSSSSQARHSPFREFLELFIVSLNLRDTWSYLRPTDWDYTRRQNNSFSRIDMFLLPEHRMERVRTITVKRNITEQPSFSDHFPLVLDLTVRHDTEEILPKVASVWCKPYEPDNRPGKISGAEIVSVIKSLTESEKLPLNGKDVKKFKKQCCQQSEVLKYEYNSMMENKMKYDHSENRHICNIQSLILSQILARRLSAFNSFKGKKKMDHNKCSYVKFQKGQQKIKWSFLEHIVKRLHPEFAKHALPPDFRFLNFLLPKDPISSEFRLLESGYPLTNAIIRLALKELKVLVSINFCKGTVCYERQVLCIHTELNSDFQNFFMTCIQEESGLKISF
ncbi:hypothetical protein HF521_017258, partial [Silurus meridionalis]